MLSRAFLYYWLALLLFTGPVAGAVWPFSNRQYPVEAWNEVGNLGLETRGKLAAFGDWDGDQFVDVFVIGETQRTVEIHCYNSTSSIYQKRHEITSKHIVEDVVPADYNQDGRLDVLILSQSGRSEGSWWNGQEGSITGRVYLQGTDGRPTDSAILVEGLTKNQPIVADINGDLKADLLGLGKGSTTSTLQFWTENRGAFERFNVPLEPASKLCTLAQPHSNAFVDIDGDCLADLFLVCQSSYSSTKSFQVWLNRKKAGFVFGGEWELPAGTGAITFADMDRDGTIDLVFPTCSSVTSTGYGKGCSLNIAYNKQKPLCSQSDDSWLAGLQHVAATNKKDCREMTQLCSSDPNFSFNLSEGSDTFTQIPIETLFPGTTSIVFSEPQTESSHGAFDIPLRIGDFNLDGYPDALVMIVNNTAAPPSGGIFGGGRSTGVQARVLQNIPCKKKDAACQDGKYKARKRQFAVARELGMESLNDIWDVRNAAWLDIAEDGAMDIILERSGKQEEGRISFIKNSVFHDAFFLKALVLNGACEGDMCPSVNGAPSYSSYGANLPGGTFKFAVTDPTGRRALAQIPQIAQTAYHALQAPYSFFGLGRTNNYVENLYIGTTKHDVEHFSTIEGVIPNSHIVVNPPLPVASNTSITNSIGSTEWHKTLYLQPGKWIQWVVVTTILIVLMLAGVTYTLHLGEKREDEIERRKTMHRINFAAFG